MEISEDYFDSYEEIDVHRLMLNDVPRMEAYKNAIFNNKHLFENKIVMDVGAGTGILSIFCAKNGAKKVYSVEASGLSKMITKVIAENELTDKIQVIENKLENIEVDSIEPVDIIISEWMGFYLLHEGMLNTILIARDRFLKKDGQLFPSVATIHAAPCQVPELFDFWDNVYDVKMTCVGEGLRQGKSSKPEVMLVDKNNLLGDSKVLAWIDIATITADEIDVVGGQELVFSCNKNGKYQGICLWFDVEFPGCELSTSPFNKPTHWKQTVIALPQSHDVEANEPVAVKITMKKDQLKPRWYNLELEVIDPDDAEHDIPCNCYMTKCIVSREFIKQHDNC
ncbi:hypothetical protein HCN44_005581 [Aphidius gifuensis]|uniref:type I protein arginine methyltransferase n=1 Tax=Aphidius gifuensis TaxID=684658 RepID=A0A835CUS9_APHGI|nr:probable protein arginine N-methyltransferase 6 [Aphidius gifuensis]KAF7997304.1 hypothetical protein HCN44_005581 [Aphidius gifuensis]